MLNKISWRIWNILKAYYCFEKIIGPKQVFITPLLDEALLVQLNHTCQFR